MRTSLSLKGTQTIKRKNIIDLFLQMDQMDIQEMKRQQTLNRQLKYPKAVSYDTVALIDEGDLTGVA